MKITCTKCGKRFDAEDHLYICPKCNHYHSQTGTHGRIKETVTKASMADKKHIKKDPFKADKKSSDLFGTNVKSKDLFKDSNKKSTLDSGVKGKLKDKLEGVNVMDVLEDIVVGDYSSDNTNDGAPEFIQTLNGEERVYTAQKKTEEKDSDAFSDAGSILKKIGLAICIIVGFIMAISSTIGEFDEWGESSSGDSDWGYTYTEELEVDSGDPMDFETFTVNVNEVCEPEVDGLKADDGFKLVQINFNSESPYEYESWEISTEVSLELYNGEEYDYPQDAYFALYEDEIASERPVEKELKEAGLVVEAHYSGEYFWIFEIPEDVIDVELLITSFVPDSEDRYSYSQNEAFRMPIEL